MFSGFAKKPSAHQLLGFPPARSSGLGTVGPVGMRTTHQLSSRSLGSGKIGVGLENWGLGRGELQEEAVTTAQSSPELLETWGQTQDTVLGRFPGLSPRPEEHWELGSGDREAKMQTA